MATIGFDQVDAGGVVGAFVVNTVVDVGLAAVTLVAGRTVAAKAALFQNL